MKSISELSGCDVGIGTFAIWMMLTSRIPSSKTVTTEKCQNATETKGNHSAIDCLAGLKSQPSYGVRGKTSVGDVVSALWRDLREPPCLFCHVRTLQGGGGLS